MKKVTLTNATIIPFWKKDASMPDEILKIIPPKDGAEFTSFIVSFNTETKVKDTAESKMRLFEKCTVFAKTEAAVKDLQAVITNGAIVELTGYESRTKSKTDDKYYTNIIISDITPISGGISDPGPADVDPNQLPF